MASHQPGLYLPLCSSPSAQQLNFQALLLDLPTELFQNILDQFIATFGIKSAIRLRLVSKAFQTLIDSAFFTGNYFKRQITAKGHRVSPVYLTKYLISKVVQDHQQESIVSRLAYGAVSVVLNGSYHSVELNEEKLRNEYIATLCRAMAFFLETQALDIFDYRDSANVWDKRQAALVAAAGMGQDDLLGQLLDAFTGTPALNSGDSNYFGSLMGIAALNGHKSTVSLLISRGFQIDFIGLLTTLQAACISGNLDLVTLLLNSHTEIQRRNYEYQSAILHAISNHHPKIAQLLLLYSTLPDKDLLTRTIFCAAAKQGIAELVTAMLKERVPVSSFDPQDSTRTAFDQASIRGHGHIVELLQRWAESHQ